LRTVHLLWAPAAALALSVSGCAASTTDLSGVPEYQVLTGKTFKLKVDCYWGEYVDLSDRVMVLQATGKHYAKGHNFSDHPADPSLVGKVKNGVRIRGIIPAGTRMRLLKVKAFDFFSDKRYFFMVEIKTNGDTKAYDAGRLADLSTNPPSFPNKRYAE